MMAVVFPPSLCAGALDAQGRTTQTQWISDNSLTIYDWFAYGYDANSNCLWRENLIESTMSELYQANGASPAEGFDGLDRQTGFARGTLSQDYRSITSASRTQSWTLDGQGNWSSVTTDSTPEDLEHNAANEITSEGFAYDTAGNLTSDGQFNYTYDAWNRLVRVETVGEAPELVATYAYDGQGRRISKTVGETTTDYYYDTSWRVIEERQGGDVTAQYVYGLYQPDVPIAKFCDFVEGAPTRTLYYTTPSSTSRPARRARRPASRGSNRRVAGVGGVPDRGTEAPDVCTCRRFSVRFTAPWRL
jgi:hypothetical protein